MNREAKRIERTGEPKRRPTHPGEILLKEFLEPAGLSQARLARHIGCDPKTINRIVKGHTGVSPAMARKLAAALRTTPDLWMNLQKAVDLWEARQEDADLPDPLLDDDSDRPAASI